MRRPRRIFRGSSLGPARSGLAPFRPTLFAGLVAIAVGCGVILIGRPTDLFGGAPPASGLVSAEAASVAVVDGQTLRLRDTVVQLAGVRAPPRGAQCRTGEGQSYDCGNAAAAALGRLVAGQAVGCRLQVAVGPGLPEADCRAGLVLLNRAIVAAGWARAASGEAALSEAERDARAADRGVWRDPSGGGF